MPLDALWQEIILRSQPFPAARIKAIFAREGEGPYTPTTSRAYVSLSILPHEPKNFPLGSPQRLTRFPVQFLVETPWSAYKTLSSLGYVQAAAYAAIQRCGDALLLSAHGYLAETSRANLFFWTGEKLCTPSLQTGCIAGVFRQQVLRLARQLGIPTEEGLYSLDALLNAQEAFTTNVIQGIVPVLGIQATGISFRTGPGSIAHLLAQHLQAELLS
uniref:branched-chain-amino-acid transaminase n=1 Tax=uncultured Bacteroidota bacterium TaxID=152509 RepID=H5SMS9_9BACT|nr:4-amino-4-deoxychorismate lyase [uncultured Bacteroidetes bacterium]